MENDDKKPTTTAFEMSAEVACEFFELCEKREAITEVEKIKILTELAEKGKMNRVWQTARPKDQFLDDLSKNYKILRIKPEEDKSE